MTIDLREKAFKVDDWWSEDRGALTVVSLEDAVAAVEEAGQSNLAGVLPTDPENQDCVVMLRSGMEALDTEINRLRRTVEALEDQRPAPEGEVGALLQESLQSGFLFGNHDEPLDAAGKRIVRVIHQRLALIDAGKGEGEPDV